MRKSRPRRQFWATIRGRGIAARRPRLHPTRWPRTAAPRRRPPTRSTTTSRGGTYRWTSKPPTRRWGTARTTGATAGTSRRRAANHPGRARRRGGGPRRKVSGLDRESRDGDPSAAGDVPPGGRDRIRRGPGRHPPTRPRREGRTKSPTRGATARNGATPPALGHGEDGAVLLRRRPPASRDDKDWSEPSAGAGSGPRRRVLGCDQGSRDSSEDEPSAARGSGLGITGFL
mmetsp:Transcript_24876/g.56280  ORF Transcript_24876/g.56280 Transcript_24876/m.56280 type:complete len:230 (-) Transcript_24876:147-836(-)